MRSDRASTIVVINGLAITAGSKPIFLASIGSVQPTNFASIIVNISVKQTVRATSTVTLSIIIIFMKLAVASVRPQSIDTRNSFQITLKISLNSMSPSESPRIIVTDA